MIIMRLFPNVLLFVKKVSMMNSSVMGNICVKNMISCMPNFALHDLLMKGIHGASLVRHDGLQLKDRWIVHKRGKRKFSPWL